MVRGGDKMKRKVILILAISLLLIAAASLPIALAKKPQKEMPPIPTPPDIEIPRIPVEEPSAFPDLTHPFFYR